MARIYTNENFPYPAVLVLRQFGHDVITTVDSGHAGKAIPDEEVLSFAISEQRVLVTLNRKHFVRLHQLNPHHSGIIFCTFDPDFSRLAQHIHESLQAAEHIDGALIRITREP